MDPSHTKPSYGSWFDLNDSVTSTQEEYESSASTIHPEVLILQGIIHSCSAPISLYLGNLPYTLNSTEDLKAFLSLTKDSQIVILRHDEKPLGRAVATVESVEAALKIVELHGTEFQDRPVYMNLDGFFGRGKAYVKQLNQAPSKKKKKKKVTVRPCVSERNKNKRVFMDPRTTEPDNGLSHKRLPSVRSPTSTQCSGE